MIEYPSMQNSSKAPRKECMVFEKLDGSNFRAKWTEKKGDAKSLALAKDKATDALSVHPRSETLLALLELLS
jgi:hypothetical protein